MLYCVSVFCVLVFPSCVVLVCVCDFVLTFRCALLFFVFFAFACWCVTVFLRACVSAFVRLCVCVTYWCIGVLVGVFVLLCFCGFVS